MPENEKLELLRTGNDLYRWMYVLKNAHTMQEDEINIVVQKTPELKKVFEVLEQLSSDPEMRKQIEENIKADQEYADDLASSLDVGKKKAKLEDARKMKKEGFSVDEMLRVTGLTEQDLKEQGIV